MGLLWKGKIIEIPGLTIISPASHGGPSWAKLEPGDFRRRRPEDWIRQIIAHTTKGKEPQHIKPGAGPGGKDKVVAEFWKGDPTHSAAQLVIDNDGSVVCLCDLYTTAAYHATVSNMWSIGVENYQENDGGIYEAVYATAMILYPALCELAGFAFQIPGAAYRNAPLQRMVHGGADCVGVYGHRDNTSNRGRGDPGDEFFRRMLLAGAEAHDVESRGDIAKWKLRQGFLNTGPCKFKTEAAVGRLLTVDGVAGPNTMRAMKACGYDRPSQIPA